ncbi:MAG: glycosyltransferase [Flavobacteriales bacterium]|nr:glycosyltransferase [Flavobacteriales bacterium]
MLPRISLVTPSYQQAPYLEECLASVRAQAPALVEHLVADGGSTDGSREIIARHARQLAWWVSERDKGQSEAINKGLAHATGQVFGWLNSDDALLPGAMERVARAFVEDPDLLVFGGRILHQDRNGTRLFEPLNDAADVRMLFCDPVINQPATFYRMEAVRAIGGVDPALHYVMDLELWWQLLFRFGTQHLRFEPVELARFRLHDASKTVTEQPRFLDEKAGLLHGLCLRTGNADLAAVLAMGHRLPQGLRGIPAGPEHRERVRDMVVHYLLKWHHTVHARPQYQMMRAFRDIDLRGIELSPVQRDRLERLDRHLRAGSWLTFRLKRKWKHWTR